MFNDYIALKNMEYRRNDVLREVEHDRLARQALGAKYGKPPFWWINVVWQRGLWRKLSRMANAGDN